MGDSIPEGRERGMEWMKTIPKIREAEGNKKSIPKIRKREGNEKTHSHSPFWERGS